MIVIAMPEERALVSGNDIIITGIGPLNVISKLMNLPRDTPIHNVGYAGSNSIPIGTRCRIGKVAAYHKAIFTDPKYVLDGNTPLYSSGDFVTETDITEPCLFDMELAFILAMGFTNVTAEKVVSDNLSLKEYFGTVNKE